MGGVVLFLLLVILVLAAIATAVTWSLGMWGRRASQEGTFEPDDDGRPTHREVSSPTLEHSRSPGD